MIILVLFEMKHQEDLENLKHCYEQNINSQCALLLTLIHVTFNLHQAHLFVSVNVEGKRQNVILRCTYH